MPSNFEQMRELIANMAGTGENVIAVNKAYLDFMGTLEGGVFLSQLIYFSDKSKRKDGYFYKTMIEWREHTYLTEYAIRKQIKILVEKGVLETKVMKANGSPTVHYKFNMEQFAPLFISFLSNRRKETANPKEPFFENEDSITKITTENTNKDIKEASAPLFTSILKRIDEQLLESLTMEQKQRLQTYVEQIEDPEVIYECINITEQETPDWPVQYLFKLLDKAIANKFTLDDVKRDHQQFKQQWEATAMFRTY